MLPTVNDWNWGLETAGCHYHRWPGNQNSAVAFAVVAHLPVCTLQDALVKLKLGSTQTQDIKTTLPKVMRYSFNTLSAVEKAMFLDVATVYCGLPKDVALGIWRERYRRELLINASWCLESLEQRCLVESSSGSLHMHDVLKYLGRSVFLTSPSVIGPDPTSFADPQIAQQYAGSRLFVSNTSLMDRSQDSWEEVPDCSGLLKVYGEQPVSVMLEMVTNHHASNVGIGHDKYLSIS
jgi:hypothetical protein